MILPHYLGVHESGEVELSEEYSEHQWVGLGKLGNFEPKIPNILEIVEKLLSLQSLENLVYKKI